jgi:hypothetical protein
LWRCGDYGWGYADNFGSDSMDSKVGFKIGNAVNRDGSAANLLFIDFVKVQCAVNDKSGWQGEVSTEVGLFTAENLARVR